MCQLTRVQHERLVVMLQLMSIWAGAFFTLFALLPSCGGGLNDGTATLPAAIPLQCTPAQVSTCRDTTAVTFVGLVRGLNISCDDYLYSLPNSEQRKLAFTASASARCQRLGPVITGKITHWSDSAGEPVGTLPLGTYRVCGFIDVNGNGRLDPGEPVYDGTYSAGAPNYALAQWHPAKP